MNYNELNAFIKHYIDCDKTQRAIMLNAEWGTGKSHYIQTELIPFLSKAGDYQCIVVSLYGLKDVSEISKSIYIDVRMSFLNKDSEGANIGKIAAKTIVKGVASFFNVDLSADDNCLKSLYESINLSKKLIILEDIERSQIDILDVLGYVNNLTEQDDAKVLLVSNEHKFINYIYSNPDKEGNNNKCLDEASIKYLTTKEKTVSDTINFCCDYTQAINNIISSFKNEELNKINTNKGIEDILDIMVIMSCYNLRTFIYACQKTIDILEKTHNNDEEFVKTIFYSVFSFSVQIKKGIFPAWIGSEMVSTELGIKGYPLYRFCYDFLRWQEFDYKNVQNAIEEHKNLFLYNHKGTRTDPDLNIIFSFFINTEKDLMEALKRIEQRLDDPYSVPFFSYPKLAFYLVKCHTTVEFDYTICKKKMISNISGKKDKIDVSQFNYSFSEDEEQCTKDLVHSFMNELKSSLNQKQIDETFFSYNSSDFEKLYYDTAEKKRVNNLGHTFISNFDLAKLVQLLLTSHPNQISIFRDNISLVYNHSVRNDFLEDDVNSLLEFKNILCKNINGSNSPSDRIVLLQINLLINELNRYIDNLK